jgi:hypothetical protein
VVAEIAELITTRARKSDRGYEILGAMGVRERKQPTDNQAHMNMAASKVLRESAQRPAAFVGRTPRGGTAWPISSSFPWTTTSASSRTTASTTMRKEERRAEPPTALTGWITRDPALARATLRYYLHVAGEPLAQLHALVVYGVWVARLGDRTRSAELFEEGVRKVRHDKTDESRRQ